MATSGSGPTPAPDFYGSMTDDSGIAYAGDRWRRRTGAIDKTTTDWATGNNKAAYHAADLLGYGTSANPPTFSPAFANGWTNFRDPVWEQYGYDLDIVKYRTKRGSGGPLNPATYPTLSGNTPANILVPAADRFKGYSMGPGYWGKTFFIWPPDPRAPNMAQAAGATGGGGSSSTRAAATWTRRRTTTPPTVPAPSTASTRSSSAPAPAKPSCWPRTR